jgi:hypothetical protein
VAANDPALAEFTETIAGPVDIQIVDPETREFVEEWRNASYNCYSSGHKFCREVCPVMQVTRNESGTPTAFHANVVAMERGELEIADVAADYVNCTRGRLLPHVGAPGRRADPAVRGLRVRPDGRAVVLRRAGRRDGLRRAGAAFRPAQSRQLAVHGHPAGPGSRSARLHT